MKKVAPMKLVFHGVRGSRPVHLSDFTEFGGNSTCIEIVASRSFKLFIDCGTGLANYFYQNAGQKKFQDIHILITHTHWDHVLTLPYFQPLFDANATITFYATDGSNGKFEDLFSRLCSFGHLGMPQGSVKANVNFVTVLPGIPFLIDNKVRVEGFQVNHQAVTLGYKISRATSSVAVITDAAPISNGNYLGDGMPEQAKNLGNKEFEKVYVDSLCTFLSGVHTLVYDTHFADENFKADWGHSTPRFALDLAKKSRINRLLMFHHAPEDNDDAIHQKLRTARSIRGGSELEIENAKEGDEWLLNCA